MNQILQPKRHVLIRLGLFILFFFTSCTPATQTLPGELDLTEEIVPLIQPDYANVLSVRVTGSPNAYQFDVEIASPDIGCGQYADWWEVFTEDGRLLYRRVLLHSHIEDQPFRRSGGPIEVNAVTTLYIRAHMNSSGYGGQVLRGSVRSGFTPVLLEPGFRSELAALPPLPEDCDF